MFSFDGYSVPKFSNLSMPSISFGEIDNDSSWYRDNNFLVVMVSFITALLMIMVIPYIVAQFVETPFCGANMTEIDGDYSVLNGYIPLERRMQCKSCPYDAETCHNGTVQCHDNYKLDQYQVICLSENGDDAQYAEIAANMAYQV